MWRTVSFSFDFVAGWKRPRWTRAGITYMDATERRQRKQIKQAWIDAGGHTDPLPDGWPVKVHVLVHKKLQSSAPKSVVARRDTTKPDVDNVGKLVMDALNGVAYHDDKQVVDLHVERDWRRRRWSHSTDVDVSWPDDWTPSRNEIRKDRASRRRADG